MHFANIDKWSLLELVATFVHLHFLGCEWRNLTLDRWFQFNSHPLDLFTLHQGEICYRLFSPCHSNCHWCHVKWTVFILFCNSSCSCRKYNKHILYPFLALVERLVSNKSMHYAGRLDRAWFERQMCGQTGSRQCRQVYERAGSGWLVSAIISPVKWQKLAFVKLLQGTRRSTCLPFGCTLLLAVCVFMCSCWCPPEPLCL